MKATNGLRICAYLRDALLRLSMLFFALLLALRLTPSAPDAPLKQPQIAVSGKTVNLTYGVGNAVYFARSMTPERLSLTRSRWRSRKL